MFHNYKLRPMLLKEEEKVVQDKEFLYEIKFDGIRALIYVSKNSFKILSRKGNDLTNKYPELKEIQKIVGDHQVIFDGEIIATNNGLPSFSLLQQRNRIKKVIDEIIEEIPVTFIAFDILYDNKNLMSESLLNRKKILEKYNDTNYFIKSKVYDNGINLFKMIKKVGLEGIVEKKKNGLYFEGERTFDWIKVKNIKVDNFLVHGYLEKTNTYSLLLGEHKNNKLKYVGKVSINKKHEIMNTLKKIKKTNNQFVNFSEDANFVKPVHTIRVRFLERTNSGMLRHAVLDE